MTHSGLMMAATDDDDIPATRVSPGVRGRATRSAQSDDLVTKAAPGVAHRYRQVQAAKEALPPVAPVNADESRWPDPEDTVNTKDPIQIKGFRRGDVLGRLHRRGTDITRDHIEAARLFRCDWDIAMHGFTSSEDPLLTAGVSGGGGGPATGPRAREVARLRAAREVERVQQAVGEAAWPMLYWVVVDNNDIMSWVAAHKGLPHPHNVKLDRDREMGKLIAVLTRLAEHYGVDSRRDALLAMRKSMARK